MKRSDVLPLIEQVILNREPSITKTYHLCFFKGEICCLPQNHTEENHIVYRILTNGQMVDGLSSNEWNWLEGEVWGVLKELKT